MSAVTQKTRRPGTTSILVVDDNKDLAHGVALIVSDLCGDIRVAHTAEAALELIAQRPVDLVLSDVRMPGMDGLSLLEKLKTSSPRAKVILFTAFGTIETAVRAMRLGALDYLTKPFDNDELLAVVERALTEIETERELLRLRAEVEGRQTFCGMVSRDTRMLGLFETLKKVAPSTATILIRGESGTGKELVARAIHETSGRKGRFVAFNAAAVPESLAEAELFGAKKGAYTGAQQDRKGHFQLAEGGTIFIDEIASMPLMLQGKLLRVLQEHELQPLGSDKTLPIDVRVVAAMNEDPARLMKEGLFRKDLYYRLAVVTLNLPPLRDRPDDIALLALRFIAELSPKVPRELTAEAQRALMAHDWPGNVRELRNVIERALLLCHGDRIEARDVVLEGEPIDLAPVAGTALPYEEAKRQAIESFQRKYVENLLIEHDHNISQAAQAAGMTRAALHRILRRLEGED
jgi:DNA-binding NtrC family response regulator